MAPRRGAPGLVGRGWAVERIENWLSSDDPALVVNGPAGTGKSALVAALAGLPAPAGYPGRFDAVHQCHHHVTSSTDPIAVLGRIAAQLARTVPGYQSLLCGAWRDEPEHGDLSALAAEVVLDSVNPLAAFDLALRLPLELLATRGRRPGVVVAIDGLDEASAGCAGLVELFADHLATPVPGLRLLLTVRSGGAARRLPETQSLDLVADCPAGVDDLAEYLDAVSGLAASERAAVVRAAQGSYVYADGVVRSAGVGGGFVHRLPAGLDALYGLALEQIGDPTSLARLVLSVLARSRDEGFTADQVAGVLGAEAARIVEVLHRCRHLLTGGDRVRPYHRCLSEYLSAHTPDPGGVDWMIARYLYQDGSGSWREAGEPEPYALRNLLPHLADAGAAEIGPAGRSAAAGEAMRDLAADPDYVAAALLAVGVDDMLSAMSYVDRSGPRPAHDVLPLADVLRRQAGALRTAREWGDPVLAAQQLVFEAATNGMSDLARRFGQPIPDSGILTLWATGECQLRLRSDALKGHRAAVTNVVVTGDGTRAVTTANDRETRVWRLASGRLVHTLPTTGQVFNLYAEPDTSRVVASTADGRAQVWDAAAGASVARMSGSRTARVTAFAVNIDGTLGASGDGDGNATIWDLTRGEPVLRLPGPGDLINAIALSPDGRAAATASLYGGVTVWDVRTATPTHRLPAVTAATSLALSPDTRCLVVGGDGLAGYALAEGEPPRLLARLITCCQVTAVAFNVSMPMYALFGGASGQVGYVRLPTVHSG